MQGSILYFVVKKQNNNDRYFKFRIIFRKYFEIKYFKEHNILITWCEHESVIYFISIILIQEKNFGCTMNHWRQDKRISIIIIHFITTAKPIYVETCKVHFDRVTTNIYKRARLVLRDLEDIK